MHDTIKDNQQLVQFNDQACFDRNDTYTRNTEPHSQLIITKGLTITSNETPPDNFTKINYYTPIRTAMT